MISKIATSAAFAPERAAASCNRRARRLEARATMAFATLAAMILAAPAHAQSAGGAGNMGTFLQNVVNVMTGPIGQSLSVLAIVGVGIGALFGALSFRTVGATIVGVMLLFSASWVVGQIVGSGTSG